MNWQECSLLRENWDFPISRFQWPAEGWAGFNCEPTLSISDITGGIAWLWTYPSDYLLRIDIVNKFLELAPLHTGGYLSGGMSFIGFYGATAVIVLIGLIVSN